MESIGIEIKKGSWNVTCLKSSFGRVRAVDSFTVEAPTVKEGAGELARRLSEKRAKQASIAVVLPRELAVARSLEIPAPKAENIPGILGFEVEKHLPLHPGDYYFGHSVISSKGNMHTVLLSAAKKTAVDGLLAEFSNAGLAPACVFSEQAALVNSLRQVKATAAGRAVSVVSAGPDMVSVDTFNGARLVYSKAIRRGAGFLERFSGEVKLAADALGGRDGHGVDEWFVCSGQEAADDITEALSGTAGAGGVKPWPNVPPFFKGSPFAFGGALMALGSGPAGPILSLRGGIDAKSSYALTAAAAALAVLFLAVAGGSYIARDFVEIMSLKSSIASMKGEKSKAQGTIDAYNRLSTTRALLEGVDGRAFPGVLDPLTELVKVLPGKTRLTAFETSGASVRIEGTTESASALILLLEEKSEMLEKAELSGQVVKTDGNMERFALNLSVRGASNGPGEGGTR